MDDIDNDCDDLDGRCVVSSRPSVLWPSGNFGCVLLPFGDRADGGWSTCDGATGNDCDDTDTDTDTEDGPCWCGEPNPAYIYDHLDASCGGSGFLSCRCGGDLCVCHHHGEVECAGCDDCDPDDGDVRDYFDEDGDAWDDSFGGEADDE